MAEQQKCSELFFYVDGLIQRLQGFNQHQQGPFGNPLRGQGRVLKILSMQPEITQKDLGYLLDMRNQSLGELLNKLEKKGYITREKSKEDRRTTNIKLTVSGKEAADKLDAAESTQEDIFSCLNDEEKIALEKILWKLKEDLEAKTIKIFEENGRRLPKNFFNHGGGFGGRHPRPQPPQPPKRGSNQYENAPRGFDMFRNHFEEEE